MRPEPFAVAALVCFAGGVGAYRNVPRPFEAALYVAIAAVLGGVCAGFALGLLDPGVPDVDYTAAGAVALGLSVFGLAVLTGRPLAGYLTAVLGGVGAALVGFESGRERAG